LFFNLNLLKKHCWVLKYIWFPEFGLGEKGGLSCGILSTSLPMVDPASAFSVASTSHLLK
jgi:hypothetical protein